MNRGPILWAALAGLAAAVSLWVLTPADDVPVILFGDDTTALERYGGVAITYRPLVEATAEQHTRTAHLLARRARRASSAARATNDNDQLTVTIPRVSFRQAESLAHALIFAGQLSINLVRNDNPLAHRLCELARHQQPGPDGDRSLRCKPDAWSHEVIGVQRDIHLAASERVSLARAVAQAPANDLTVPPELRVVYERVEHREPYHDDPGEPGPFWQTHLVEERPIVDHRDIASARVTHDPQSQRYVVIAELRARGAERFGVATKRHVGHRLAVLMSDTVLSAPVIQTAIPGGQFMITPGASDLITSRAECDFLASSLTAGTDEPLPVTLQVADIAPIAPTVSDRQMSQDRIRFAGVAGVIVAVLIWLLLAAATRFGEPWLRPLVDSQRQQNVNAGRPPWLRLLVTLGAIAAAFLSAYVLLPSIDPDKLAALAQSGDVTASLLSRFSVFALGINPIITAFLAVEIATLVVPRWRPLRREGHAGGPSGRARMLRSVAVLSVVLSLVQGYIVAGWLASMSAVYPGVLHDSATTGGAHTLLIATTLTGGVMVMWVAATLISRYGLGNGFAVLILAGFVTELDAVYHHLEAWPITGIDALGSLAAILAVALATTLILRTRIGGPAGLRLPTSGLVPIVEATGLTAMLAPVLLYAGQAEWAAWFANGPVTWLDQLSPVGNPRPLLFLAVLIVLCVGLAWLFTRPLVRAHNARVVETGADARAHLAMFARATAISAGYLVALAWLLRAQSGDRLAVLDLLSVIVVTAIIMDLIAEWRMRTRIAEPVPIWPLHHVQSVDLVLSALAHCGMVGHARTRYHRTLLYFFGPYLPIEIMVAQTDAARARTAVAALFADIRPTEDA